ncbi:MAG: hypothetical protein ACI4WS_12830 [Oscillospiraceae bacterium]
MNFKDEYKKSAESVSPDREAMDRMKAAVLAKIAEEAEHPAEVHEQHTEETSPHRKPLPFRQIAAICGTAAACAVVTISAMTLLPRLQSADTMVNESSTAVMNEVAGNAENRFDIADSLPVAADDVLEDAEAAAEDAGNGSVTITDTTAESNGTDTSTPVVSTTAPVISSTVPTDTGKPAAPEYTEPGTFEEYIPDDNALPDTGVTEPDAITDKAPADADDASADAGDHADKSQTDNSAGASEADEMTSIIEVEEVAESVPADTSEVSYDDSTSDEPEWSEPEYTMEAWEETEELLYTEEAIISQEAEADETEPPEPPKLVITKGWLTYGGIRYDLDSKVTSAKFPYFPTTAVNVLDGKEYYLNIDGYVLKLFDGDKNFLGLYRKRA